VKDLLRTTRVACPGEPMSPKAVKMETPKHSSLQLTNNSCQPKTALKRIQNELSEKRDSCIGNKLTL